MSVDQLPQPGQALGMRTIVCGDPPPALAWLIAERQRLGLDAHDEIWDGDYHVAPFAHGRHGFLEAEVARVLAPRSRVAGMRWLNGLNLGDAGDFRVPDGGAVRGDLVLWFATAALVVEVLSPSDETFLKFEFYFEHGVEEIVVADGDRKLVRIWTRGDGAFQESAASMLLDVTAAVLMGEIDWA